MADVFPILSRVGGTQKELLISFLKNYTEWS